MLADTAPGSGPGGRGAHDRPLHRRHGRRPGRRRVRGSRGGARTGGTPSTFVLYPASSEDGTPPGIGLAGREGRRSHTGSHWPAAGGQSLDYSSRFFPAAAAVRGHRKRATSARRSPEMPLGRYETLIGNAPARLQTPGQPRPAPARGRENLPWKNYGTAGRAGTNAGTSSLSTP